ncbi:MAG: methyl-accepting chemotaxis protein [Candidatus Thiodiazotropha sp. (ex Lucina aurantia)]|uniref:Methyl-accepting chemotaxis protein McpB n=2 Tax=Candidatus Thiodiazotropha TaxID=1913444 RepID=A0A7Z0VMJ0_9GAMM|nr:methyl-accepting chemotaxis protein [Candidatus Thiodiazotropha endolucinida]MBT3010746.1 methyl-accepting chemotaxis protein [Candidatus Thiodiazotropha sp. (ex Lucina pensylvanica)]MBT3015341.1 methyl-accepting chemotaxis protein [Candidatus Thiodiazotropha taylori]MBT3039043.1 methyl-accepting chemotaxis protein [Candidatus Thiodiazotropha sp. (ex Codakia orbicularis)]MBV2101978.1 methyl-accepting chemotaxis protein [Candidatus Thiodiazotropha sp. (ex Lucina aurantia)]MBT3022425.1 methyl
MKGRRAGSTLPSNKVITILAILVLVSLILALVTFLHTTQRESYDEQYLIRAAEQQVLAQRIAKYAISAARGELQSFAPLKKSRDRFDNIMWELKNGTKSQGLPASPIEVMPTVRNLENKWLELQGNIDEILKAQENILAIDEFSAVVSEFVPQLQELSEELAEVLINSNAPRRQIYIATEQEMLIQRINSNVNLVLEGGQETAAAIDQFSRDADFFGRILQGLLNGDKELGIAKVDDKIAKQRLADVSTLFATINDNTTEIISNIPDVLPALEAASVVNNSSDNVSNAAEELIAAFGESPGRFSVLGIKAGPVMIAVFGAAAVLFLVLLGVQLIMDAQRREQASKQQNEANQKAILQLLDEMGDLADGDLTVTASVTEDITGAIADSINYAIEALRELVTTINSTSEQVSGATQESRATAMHLAEASEHQAEQITQANESIKTMTQAIDQMSQDATESAEVAKRSVEIASTGADTVRNTISGMDNIREQIQETSKRIKRLGESSQEIGDIVELIDDIADQTNILALNAAMQAAMAGEAGRGFAVVADEVQRLAERSINATKQIEALVKTIQADTNEAVTSMEASTSGVVKGATLAEDAGEALKEIESVSQYIADLTGKIASSAQDQSSQSVTVKDTMSVIQEITNQTSEGTHQTANSIGMLADLSDQLQKSVAGFRLPS